MPHDLNPFMRETLQLSRESVAQGGGPFAAIIVRDGDVVARAANSVTQDNDPTAHAEVNAIRQACRTLNTFDLSGCTIFTSCEPCPMCLGAIYWARVNGHPNRATHGRLNGATLRSRSVSSEHPRIMA